VYSGRYSILVDREGTSRLIEEGDRTDLQFSGSALAHVFKLFVAPRSLDELERKTNLSPHQLKVFRTSLESFHKINS